MRRKAWAVVCFVLVIAAGSALPMLFWHDSKGITYVQASIKPEASTLPIVWPGGIVDVNTADLEELQSLSGINRSQIQALIDDRELRGPFDFPEDLIAVKGIGEKTLEKIYDQLDFTSRIYGDRP